jgi:hypothetical protein
MKKFKEIMRCVGVKFNKLIYNISNFLKRNINRLTLSKVLVIFVVGLLSRVLVNNFWDVNVFVDYLNSISLIYYGFMSIFVVIVNELYSHIDIIPKISKDVFRISSIRKSISVLISNISNKVKVPISGDIGLDKVLDKPNKVRGVLLMENRDGISSGPPLSNRPTHYAGKKLSDQGDIIPSGVTGLYDGSRISVNKNLSGYIKVKSRLY